MFTERSSMQRQQNDSATMTKLLQYFQDSGHSRSKHSNLTKAYNPVSTSDPNIKSSWIFSSMPLKAEDSVREGDKAVVPQGSPYMSDSLEQAKLAHSPDKLSDRRVINPQPIPFMHSLTFNSPIADFAGEQKALLGESSIAVSPESYRARKELVKEVFISKDELFKRVSKKFKHLLKAKG